MRMRDIAMTAACLLAASCSGGKKEADNAVNASADEMTENAAVSNIATPATDPLAAYIGKYPFDKVDGKTFYDQPIIKAAVAKAVPEKDIAKMVSEAGDGPAGPIAKIDGKVAAWACEAHNCGDHNWTILADGAAATAQVCYHDFETMQEQSRWYDGTGASAMKPGGCPSE